MNRMDQDLISAQILLPDGSVNLNKINLISGAITAPLVRMVYVFYVTTHPHTGTETPHLLRSFQS